MDLFEIRIVSRIYQSTTEQSRGLTNHVDPPIMQSEKKSVGISKYEIKTSSSYERTKYFIILNEVYAVF